MRVSRLVGLGLGFISTTARCERCMGFSPRPRNAPGHSTAARARSTKRTWVTTDEGAHVFDTTSNGNSNSGHDYGTNLLDNEKHDLMEYLKTL
jgi:hypothetical protein